MHFPQPRGWIELITGTMFGGKSTELVRRLERSLIAGQRTIAFSRDSRFNTDSITTHSGRSIDAIFVEGVTDIEKYLTLHPDTKVIGIDEVQFFDRSLSDLCHNLALKGMRVICAGLDQDYNGIPFETTTALMVEAEEVIKMPAICTSCGAPAIRNHLKIEQKDRIIEGAEESYEALCRFCYVKEVG